MVEGQPPNDSEPNFLHHATQQQDTFGSLLKGFRNRRGLRQVDVAEWLRVTPSAVTHWEKNRQVPSKNQYYPALREALDLNDEELEQLVTAAAGGRWKPDAQDVNLLLIVGGSRSRMHMHTDVPLTQVDLDIIMRDITRFVKGITEARKGHLGL